jgi:hypothetical protein
VKDGAKFVVLSLRRNEQRDTASVAAQEVIQIRTGHHHLVQMRISLAAAFEVAVQPLVQVHGIEGLRGVYGPASMPSSRRPIPGIVN